MLQGEKGKGGPRIGVRQKKGRKKVRCSDWGGDLKLRGWGKRRRNTAHGGGKGKRIRLKMGKRGMRGNHEEGGKAN